MQRVYTLHMCICMLKCRDAHLLLLCCKCCIAQRTLLYRETLRCYRVVVLWSCSAVTRAVVLHIRLYTATLQRGKISHGNALLLLLLLLSLCELLTLLCCQFGSLVCALSLPSMMYSAVCSARASECARQCARPNRIVAQGI